MKEHWAWSAEERVVLKGDEENGASALDSGPLVNFCICVDHAPAVHEGVITLALHVGLLTRSAVTSMTVPAVDSTPVSGLLSKSLLSERVRRPSCDIWHPQH